VDCNACSVCHHPIDHKAVDEDYPHLSEDPDQLPPKTMTSLEADIYWGTICVDCARSAESALPVVQAPYRSAVKRAWSSAGHRACLTLSRPRPALETATKEVEMKQTNEPRGNP
jgi:hypothetical protein